MGSTDPRCAFLVTCVPIVMGPVTNDIQRQTSYRLHNTITTQIGQNRFYDDSAVLMTHNLYVLFRGQNIVTSVLSIILNWPWLVQCESFSLLSQSTNTHLMCKWNKKEKWQCLCQWWWWRWCLWWYPRSVLMPGNRYKSRALETRYSAICHRRARTVIIILSAHLPHQSSPRRISGSI